MSATTNTQAYVPLIKGYKPFYIQADNSNGAKDTRYWGMVAKTNPYPILPTVKAPYSNDWKDENGTEEYVEQMNYESFELTVTFYAKAFSTQSQNAAYILKSQIKSFFDYIQNGYIRVYDSYTELGWQNVRYQSYAEESFKAKDNWARAIFSVTFKVNDPTTEVYLQNGELVTDGD